MVNAENVCDHRGHETRSIVTRKRVHDGPPKRSSQTESHSAPPLSNPITTECDFSSSQLSPGVTLISEQKLLQNDLVVWLEDPFFENSRRQPAGAC